MYENIVLSSMEKDIMNPTLISTIQSVLDMIKEDASNPYYRMTTSNINIAEELAFDAIFDDSIANYIDTAMQRNNLRFIYCPDKDFGTYTMKFSAKSTINDSVNVFTTFFIGNTVKSDSNYTEELISHIAVSIIEGYIRDKYNIDLMDLVYSINPQKSSSTDFVNNILNMIDVYICYFNILDYFLDLRYTDSDRIINILPDLHSYEAKISDVMEECYKFAITESMDNTDYRNLLKKCTRILIGVQG